MEQFSQLWYIDQLNSHVKGSVEFIENNTEMKIWLLYGRYPYVVGLDTKEGPDCKVKVKVVKEGKKNWEIGCEEDCNSDEKHTSSPDFDGWDNPLGIEIATLSCNELITNDWVDRWDKLVLRYEKYFD